MKNQQNDTEFNKQTRRVLPWHLFKSKHLKSFGFFAAQKNWQLLKGSVVTAVLYALLLFSLHHAYSLPFGGEQPPRWHCNLASQSLACTPLSTSTQGHTPSPVIADVDGDGVMDIVVATANGRVIAIKDNGSSAQKIFDVDLASYYGMLPHSQTIRSSPAVADIDNDGFVEIVVGTATGHAVECRKGGVIVLEHDGTVKPNWPQLTYDGYVPPDNCPDPVFGTPALGDLDGDGDLEIVVGAFDKRIYAWHHDGTLLPGFPPPSFHYPRFGWNNLSDRLADTIWGSPALGDLDGDGFLDIIIGTDEGKFDHTFGGNSGGWVCPYTIPNLPGWIPGYCGGAVYALDRFGRLLPGFPIYKLEIFQSTPALYDIDRDGRPEMFVGTGTYYHDNSPDHPTDGFRVFGWDYTGNDLPGWEGGKVVGGVTPSAPAIGDIDGDGDPEIVALARDQQVYAWHHTGITVTGFPMTPRDTFGEGYAFNVGHGLVLADISGDGAMELVINTGWVVTVVDGAGVQLTATSIMPINGPVYWTGGQLVNTTAVGDIDGDGELELVAQNANLRVWDLPDSGTADWPMFKYDATRSSHHAQPTLTLSHHEIDLLVNSSVPAIDVPVVLRNPGTGVVTWTTAITNTTNLSVQPASGLLTNTAQVMTITVTLNDMDDGTYPLGLVVVDGDTAAGSPQTITVQVRIHNRHLYLPFVSSD